jgi:hypothetical protein
MESNMKSSKAAFHSENICKGESAGVIWNMSPRPSGTSLLSLSGDLKPGWLGTLSSNLSSNKISILNGAAMKHSPLHWDSSFEVAIEPGSPVKFTEFNPLPALTETTERAAGSPLELTDYQIEYSTRHKGSIYTEISGADCIGFLYEVLRIFSFYSLFPTELDISTKGKKALDRFWLKGIGASVPEKDDISALNRRLLTMLSN